MLFPRVLLATAVLNPALAARLLPLLMAPAVMAVASAAWGAWRSRAVSDAPATTANPLKVGAALQMAALFQLVLYAVDAAGSWFGAAGLLASGAVLGLTDVDALTVTMARGATADVTIAARAVAVGVLSNTLLKLGLALGLGSAAFRRTCGAGLAAVALASGLALAW